jgi:ribosomal protein L37AE/L43A
MHEEDRRYLCTQCHWGHVEYRRWKAGYNTCMPCGEEQAKQRKHTIVPMHKSNYTVITDMEMLVGINNKGGLTK